MNIHLIDNSVVFAGITSVGDQIRQGQIPDFEVVPNGWGLVRGIVAQGKTAVSLGTLLRNGNLLPLFGEQLFGGLEGALSDAGSLAEK